MGFEYLFVGLSVCVLSESGRGCWLVCGAMLQGIPQSMYAAIQICRQRYINIIQ